MNVVAPAARDKKTYLLLNNEEILNLTWPEGDMSPQSVTVTYNSLVEDLSITEVNLMLKLLVDVE